MKPIDQRLWIKRLGDATSQWFNVALWNGDPNECISGRSWREGRKIRIWIDRLFRLFGDKDHCRRAYQKDNEWAFYRVAKHRIYGEIKHEKDKQ